MQRHGEGSATADHDAWPVPGRPHAGTRWAHFGGIGTLVIAGAVLMGACGSGPDGSGSAHVASVAHVGHTGHTGHDGTTTTTDPGGNATTSLNAWATCMHSNGDPDQTPPTIDSDKIIHVWIPEESAQLSNAVHNGTAPCNQYLVAAQMALRDGQPFPQPPSDVQEVQFAECMRASGFPNYPNPSGPDDSQTDFNGTGIDPNSPQVENASNTCNQKVGIHPVDQSALGDAGDIEVGSGPGNGPPSGTPGGNGGSGANTRVVPGSPGSGSSAGG